MKRFPKLLLIAALWYCASGAVVAAPNALLGVAVGFPKTAFISTAGQGASYDGAALTITSTPTFAVFNEGDVPEVVANGDLEIIAQIDASGHLSAGSFTISGSVGPYSQVLLTGEVEDYGMLDVSGPGGTDLADFRLRITGGSSSGAYADTQIVATVALPGSSYAGSFAGPFASSGASGEIGLLAPPPRPDALLGVQISHPRISFISTGSQAVSYDGSILSVSATPVWAMFTSGGDAEPIAAGSLQIFAGINARGYFSSGTFRLTGTVTDSASAASYTGTLLEGYVQDYGTSNISAYGGTDLMDLELMVTGGGMSALFPGSILGVTVALETSTYDGHFGGAWSAKAVGDLGLIPQEPTPPPEDPTDPAPPTDPIVEPADNGSQEGSGPSSTGAGGGSGGCTLNARGGVDPVFAVIALIAGVGVARTRARSRH